MSTSHHSHLGGYRDPHGAVGVLHRQGKAAPWIAGPLLLIFVVGVAGTVALAVVVGILRHLTRKREQTWQYQFGFVSVNFPPAWFVRGMSSYQAEVRAVLAIVVLAGVLASVLGGWAILVVLAALTALAFSPSVRSRAAHEYATVCLRRRWEQSTAACGVTATFTGKPWRTKQGWWAFRVRVHGGTSRETLGEKQEELAAHANVHRLRIEPDAGTESSGWVIVTFQTADAFKDMLRERWPTAEALFTGNRAEPQGEPPPLRSPEEIAQGLKEYLAAMRRENRGSMASRNGTADPPTD